MIGVMKITGIGVSVGFTKPFVAVGRAVSVAAAVGERKSAIVFWRVADAVRVAVDVSVGLATFVAVEKCFVTGAGMGEDVGIEVRVISKVLV